MLMKSQLTFEQLRRHGTRLRAYLQSHPDSGLDETCDITYRQTTTSIRVNPYSPSIPDRAAEDPDFELAIDSNESEENFPFFEELTVEVAEDDE